MSVDLFDFVTSTKHLFTEVSSRGHLSLKWMLKKLLYLHGAEDRLTIYWILLCVLIIIIITTALYWKFCKKNDTKETCKQYLYEAHSISGRLNPTTESLTRCIRILNQSPFFINHPKPPYNYTPFLRACWSGNVTLVRYMLQNGADINSCTACGETPIYLASYRIAKTKTWNSSILDLLYKAGCPLSVPNVKGITALHYAANAGHLSLTRWLLIHGAHQSLPPSRTTPFDLAVRYRDETHMNIAVLLELYCPEMVVAYKKKLKNKGQ